jgi:hypothetical protein
MKCAGPFWSCRGSECMSAKILFAITLGTFLCLFIGCAWEPDTKPIAPDVSQPSCEQPSVAQADGWLCLAKTATDPCRCMGTPTTIAHAAALTNALCPYAETCP